MTELGAGQEVGDWAAGSLEFRRGWLAATAPINHEIARKWQQLRHGSLTLAVHPALGFVAAELRRHGVLFLGDVVDPERACGDQAAIARETLNHLRAGGAQAAIRYVAYLGGRFTCLLREDDTVSVVPDCVGSLPTYWHARDGQFTVGSHLQLVAEVATAPVDADATSMWKRISAARSFTVLFWPGAETPYSGVRPLIPNHVLNWAPDQAVTHRRFYPFPDTALDPDSGRCYKRFVDLFTTQVRLLAARGRVGLSLTEGADSQASFAAALPHLRDDSLAWTYVNLRRPHEGHQRDLVAARELAAAHGVKHIAVDLGVDTDTAFMAAYSRTMGLTKQWQGLANAYRYHLPRDVMEFQSLVAEVGTGFYKKRTDDPPDAARLASLYASGEKHGLLPEVHEAMERFIDYADFRPDTIAPLDYHDLIYWEARMGRWGVMRWQEGDLAHRPVLPFNARGVVEALQAAPLH